MGNSKAVKSITNSVAGGNRARLPMISLFTGAGGLDLGFEAAGFESIACVELDRDARQTIMSNRPTWNLLREGDIHRLDAKHVLAAAGAQPGDIALVLGGPPCQPFSKSAYWVTGKTERLGDPRARTLNAMLDVIEAALPRAIVIENVRGIGYRKKDEALRLVDRRFRRINRRHGTMYRPIVEYLNAAAYGAPQTRERAFIVAFREEEPFVTPAPTHGTDSNRNATAGSSLLPVTTAWDAIGDLAPGPRELPQLALTGKWAELIPSIPEGRNYLFHTARGGGLPLFGWRTRYWSFLLKLAKEQPSWTLQAEPGPGTGPFHWANRRLSVLEMCRLQTFPDSWKISGDYRTARRQIGNAVPPALAEALAQKVRHALLKERSNMLLISTLATRPRPCCSDPSAVAPVPRKYLNMLGKHPEHAGTGRGPGARIRVTGNVTGVSPCQRLPD